MIFASGLKYIGVGTTALGWILCATLFATALFWAIYVRPWQAGVGSGDDGALAPPPAASGTGPPIAARAGTEERE